MSKPRIGELLVKLGYLSGPQLEGALIHQRQWGVGLGRSAIVCGFCTEEQVLGALSRQLGLPTIDLDKVELGSAFSPLIPERIAVQHAVVPLRTTGARSEVLVVAMAPPASLTAQDVVRAISKKSRLEVYLASDEALARAIGRLYHGVKPGTETGFARQTHVERGALQDIGGSLTDRVVASPVFVASKQPTSDLVDQLKLSANARRLIESVGAKHAMSSEDVVRKVLEMWAANRSGTAQ